MAPGPEVAIHTPTCAGELGVAGGGERGHFLVPGLDEAGIVVGAPEGGDEAVDAVAGVGEDLGDVPLTQAVEDKVGDVLADDVSRTQRGGEYARRSRLLAL